MQRDVLRMGDPRLLRIAKPVTEFATPELNALIADLFDTMRAKNGVGIAAPQIGVDLRVVIFGFEHNARYPEAPPVPQTVLINPVILPLTSERDQGWEGCLSVPGMRGVVRRFTKIKYSGFDVDGNAIERIADDFHARVVQHECDHLDGVLYPQRIDDMTQFGFNEELFPSVSLSDD